MGMVCRHAEDLLPLLRIIAGPPDPQEECHWAWPSNVKAKQRNIKWAHKAIRDLGLGPDNRIAYLLFFLESLLESQESSSIWEVKVMVSAFFARITWLTNTGPVLPGMERSPGWCQTWLWSQQRCSKVLPEFLKLYYLSFTLNSSSEGKSVLLLFKSRILLMVSFEEILRGKVFDPPTEAWSFSILFLSFATGDRVRKPHSGISILQRPFFGDFSGSVFGTKSQKFLLSVLRMFWTI